MDIFPFLFGPLFYLYFKSYLFEKEALQLKKHWRHFLPAGAYLLYSISLFRYSSEEYLALFITRQLTQEWTIIYFILTFCFTSYLYASFRLFIQFYKVGKKAISFDQNIQYLYLFFGAISIGFLCALLFALDFFFNIQFFNFTQTYIGWTTIPFVTYLISYYSIKQPAVLQVEFPKEKALKVKEEDHTLIKTRLEKTMREEKLYLNTTLTLQSLAQTLEVSPTKLSWVINSSYDCGFYDFINNYRLKAFVVKLLQNEQDFKTIESLAYEVGFNSKTTFNKCFKKKHNRTPRQFLSQLHTNEETRLKTTA